MEIKILEILIKLCFVYTGRSSKDGLAIDVFDEEGGISIKFYKCGMFLFPFMQ